MLLSSTPDVGTVRLNVVNDMSLIREPLVVFKSVFGYAVWMDSGDIFPERASIIPLIRVVERMDIGSYLVPQVQIPWVSARIYDILAVSSRKSSFDPLGCRSGDRGRLSERAEKVLIADDGSEYVGPTGV